MILLTTLIVVSTVIFCLALAAGSSGISANNLLDSRDKVGRDAVTTLEASPKPFKTTHQGVDTLNAPIVSAAGLQ